MEWIVLSFMVISFYGLYREFCCSTSVPPVQSQVQVRRDGSVVVKVPADKIECDWSVINQQIDQYLGCTYTEWVIPDRKYRPRPDLKWFCTNFGATLEPSPAEQKIIDELVRYDIRWEREISFAGLSLSTGGWARYDIWLPDHNTVIEYHGRCWHVTEQRVNVDTIKEQFCINNKINMIVWNSRDYYHIPDRVEQLMSKIGVMAL